MGEDEDGSALVDDHAKHKIMGGGQQSVHYKFMACLKRLRHKRHGGRTCGKSPERDG